MAKKTAKVLESVKAALAAAPASAPAAAPHLEVSALAGTGKTTTIVQGLIAAKGGTPAVTPSPEQAEVWRQLGLGRLDSVRVSAFNRTITAEVGRKLEEAGLGGRGVEARGIHSLGLGAVTKAFGRQQASEDAVKEVLCGLLGTSPRDLGRREGGPALLAAADRLVGLCKQTLTDPTPENLDALCSRYDVELDGQREEAYQLVPDALEACTRPAGRISFDDMIWLPVRLGLPVYRTDTQVVDECVPGWTPVMLADGRSVTIREIVESADEFMVRAYDTATGTARNCRVVARQKLLNQKPLVKIKARHHHRTGTNRKCNFVVCTTDHKVWTVNRGWVPAGEVRRGDDVIVETAARTTQKGKVTKSGRDTLSGLQRGNTRGLGNPGPSKEHFNRVKGGNGRGPTLAEAVLFDGLLGTCPDGDWRLGHVVKTGEAPQHGRGSRPSHYKIDIADPGTMVAVEVDGKSHRGREDQDARKDEFLKSKGWAVVRVPNRRAVQETAAVVREILAASPRGEGCQGGQCPRPARVVSVDPVAIPDNYVYDITVEDCHNFYANGVLVHNCQDMNRCQQELMLRAGHRLVYVGDRHQSIYGFAGADVESMDRLRGTLGADAGGVAVAPLTVTRRCGHAVAAVAREYVPAFTAHPDNPPGRVGTARYTWAGVGTDRREVPWEKTYAPRVKEGDLVLCRGNAPLVSECFRFLRRGLRATILGRKVGDGLAALVRRSKRTGVPALLAWLDDWRAGEEAKEAAKRFPSEARVQAVLDRYLCLVEFCTGLKTVDEVLGKICSVFADKQCPRCRRGYDVSDKQCDNPACGGATLVLPAGVRFGTVHKSKGLEARRVFWLRPAGVGPREDKLQDWELVQERNLKYVAVTRAIEELTVVS